MNILFQIRHFSQIQRYVQSKEGGVFLGVKKAVGNFSALYILAMVWFAHALRASSGGSKEGI